MSNAYGQYPQQTAVGYPVTGMPDPNAPTLQTKAAYLNLTGNNDPRTPRSALIYAITVEKRGEQPLFPKLHGNPASIQQAINMQAQNLAQIGCVPIAVQRINNFNPLGRKYVLNFDRNLPWNDPGIKTHVYMKPEDARLAAGCNPIKLNSLTALFYPNPSTHLGTSTAAYAMGTILGVFAAATLF